MHVPCLPSAESLMAVLSSPKAAAGDFAAGLAAEEFRAHFQPIVSVSSRKVVAAEALVRWYRPGGSCLAPDQLVPLVEQAGLGRELSCRMFELAVAQQRAWREAGDTLGVTVNVVVADLLDAGLVDHLAQLLTAQPTSLGGITLELNSRSGERDLEQVSAVLAGLRKLGVRVALDGFGGGCCSFEQLRRLPVDLLKIDRRYVAAMFTDRTSAALLRSMLELARSLQLATVVEGVETDDAWTALRVLGVDLLQGRAYSGPLPPHKFTELLGQ
jgi:EAL domain-containing protein (putative c-di-GMP-specific phosphodiesterase class I)